MDSNAYAIQGLVFLAGVETSWIDLALRLVSGVAGFVALLFMVYVVFLKRKWKRDEELTKEKEENRRLAYKGKIAALKTELKPTIQATTQKVGSILDQLTKLESAQGDLADHTSLHTLKDNIDNDFLELNHEFSAFKNSCAKRHDKLAAFGSLADLKARVDELARKIDGLEDFRHKSADRYVLMTNYQQDTRMITDAIGVLRDDLRAVIEMVDKL